MFLNVVRWILLIFGGVFCLGSLSMLVSEQTTARSGTDKKPASDDSATPDANTAGCMFLVGVAMIALGWWMGSWKAVTGRHSGAELAFTGHITHETDRTPNGYLVLLFLNNEEVGRAWTRRDAFEESDVGVDDGYFEITVENTYELNMGDLEPQFERASRREGFLGLKRTRYLWNYFPDLAVGSTTAVPPAEREIDYKLHVTSWISDTLPTGLEDENSTFLNERTGEVLPKMP